MYRNNNKKDNMYASDHQIVFFKHCKKIIVLLLKFTWIFKQYRTTRSFPQFEKNFLC